MSDQIAGLDELNKPTGDVESPVDTDTVSLDSLHEIEVDNAAVDDTLRRGLMPAGTYLTNPEEFGEMTPLVQRMEEKDDAGKVLGTRLVITITGRGRAKVRLSNGNGTAEQRVVEGRIRVQISPDARRKVDYTTKEQLEADDSKTTLYAQAVKAYEQQFKEKPKSVGALVDYLTKYPVRFRVIQIGVPTKNNPTPDGEPRNFVMGIYAASR